MKKLLLAATLCLQLLTACAKISTASVNIHGVNYTAQEFNYRVEDPSNPDNHGGGEMVDSFSAGGTLCCYELPRIWKPGMQLDIHTIRYINPPPDAPHDPRKAIEEIRETHRVTVPEYPKGRPGELWVLRNADGTFGVVISDYQPDHAKWPGTVKGWPVPSVEYQREYWDMYIKDAEGSVEVYQKMLSDLSTEPVTRATKNWEYTEKIINEDKHFMKFETDSRGQRVRELMALHARFTGPTDPKFIAWLQADYEQSLRDAQAKVQKYKDSRP
ncbi:MAG: DUF3304 domain-containing protein [Burkholderiales bacterium]|nr:DUF3304 domain-containing protein [Burkholderiales bacterium]